MGERKNEKGQRFEFLVKRIDDSIRAGYFIEASSLVYALLEERTYTVLKRIGVNCDEKRDKLSKCIKKFEKAIINNQVNVSSSEYSNDEILAWLKDKFIDSGLVGRIDIWRDKRNIVTHDLAKQNIDYDELKEFSEEGREIFRKYTLLIMKLKKMLH